ncbi:hypothetical protein AGABI2DRAFT_193150 [Agaricus bisporus var. bisporus H97]|uniref:hypothetical protein n=1 Tax=Agaricus bisporus var. bisporus (strain H97 / ATCC MYA-4626 / FGSC 10389) TaxID=936046 RepID=UPI00029F6E7A|nr:hypothetical protein AGABI2DRAFT_193150 [Agaricus bisporus var. bisporus H97]EKV46431.1 hypothetical protein AGABI2DRAFT_193150 [Agaricus bisporus var. bisporus H97]
MFLSWSWLSSNSKRTNILEFRQDPLRFLCSRDRLVLANLLRGRQQETRLLSSMCNSRKPVFRIAYLLTTLKIKVDKQVR